MTFVKGNKVWLGKNHSLETRLKLSLIKKGIPSKLKGRILSAEMRQKLSLSRKGIVFSKEHLENLSLSHVGQKAGSQHHNWKGGVSTENERIRKSATYRRWRKAVFERDKYTCVLGGREHGNKLQADHIKPFALFPELRFELSNGQTLCISCHRKTDTWGSVRAKILCKS